MSQFPVTGRYISRDPLGYPNGLNNYLYCSNNPVNRIDPLGLEEKKPAEKKPKDEVRHYDVAVFLKDNKSQAAWGSSDPEKASGREDNSRGISLIKGDYTPKQVAEKIRAACGEFQREAEKDGVKFDITVSISGHGAGQYISTGSGQFISPESAKEFETLKGLGIKQINIGACTRNVSQMDSEMLDVKNQEKRDNARKNTYDAIAKAAGTEVVGTLGPDVDARGARIAKENARKYTTTGDRDKAIDPINDTGWVIPPQSPGK